MLPLHLNAHAVDRVGVFIFDNVTKEFECFRFNEGLFILLAVTNSVVLVEVVDSVLFDMSGDVFGFVLSIAIRWE